MVVGFLVLNMVVGIVVSNYQLCQEKQEKADKKLKSLKTKESMGIVDKTRYGKKGKFFTETAEAKYDCAVVVQSGLSIIALVLSQETRTLIENLWRLLKSNSVTVYGQTLLMHIRLMSMYSLT